MLNLMKPGLDTRSAQATPCGPKHPPIHPMWMMRRLFSSRLDTTKNGPNDGTCNEREPHGSLDNSTTHIGFRCVVSL